VVHPRENALVGGRIDALQFRLKDVFRNAIQLEDDYALDLGG
jgi:hypothetical protein